MTCADCNFYSPRSDTFGICSYHSAGGLALVVTKERTDSCVMHIGAQLCLPGIEPTPLKEDT